MNPEGPLQEKDWKYMRSIHDELLHALCSRINDGAVQRATRSSGNPHERYLELYAYVKESDKLVAECFDDWRRSTLPLTILVLRSHGLLSDAHVEHFSEGARAWLASVEASDLL